MLCANCVHAVRRLSSVKGVSKFSRTVADAADIAVGFVGPSRISRNESPIGRLGRLSEGAAEVVGVAITGREGAADGGVGCAEGGTAVVTGREVAGCAGFGCGAEAGADAVGANGSIRAFFFTLLHLCQLAELNQGQFQ